MLLLLCRGYLKRIGYNGRTECCCCCCCVGDRMLLLLLCRGYLKRIGYPEGQNVEEAGRPEGERSGDKEEEDK